MLDGWHVLCGFGAIIAARAHAVAPKAPFLQMHFGRWDSSCRAGLVLPHGHRDATSRLYKQFAGVPTAFAAEQR